MVDAFKEQSVKATVDVTHLRVSATPTSAKAQKTSAVDGGTPTRTGTPALG